MRYTQNHTGRSLRYEKKSSGCAEGNDNRKMNNCDLLEEKIWD